MLYPTDNPFACPCCDGGADVFACTCSAPTEPAPAVLRAERGDEEDRDEPAWVIEGGEVVAW